MMFSKDKHSRGSREVWEELFRGQDTSYSEKPEDQRKLFELVKVDFLKNIFPKPPASILEVGCGTAFVSLYFGKRGYRTVCLDINKPVLEMAKMNFKKEGVRGKFVWGDAEKLSFKEGEFDVVCSFGLLEHFQDPSRAIREMVRVLRNGGLFFADIVPNRFSCQSLGNIFNALVSFSYSVAKGRVALGFLKARSVFKPHYFENSISWQDYRKIIVKAGIKEVWVRGNRPFPRLTLPGFLDRLYAELLSLFVPVWKAFDNSGSILARFWGAGLWFWGKK